MQTLLLVVFFVFVVATIYAIKISINGIRKPFDDTKLKEYHANKPVGKSKLRIQLPKTYHNTYKMNPGSRVTKL